MHDERRAANVLAVTDVSVLVLSRQGFKELLGPLETLMNAHAAEYRSIMKGYSRCGKVRPACRKSRHGHERIRYA